MSANGTLVLSWLGGENAFCLAKVGLILDLEDKCGVGIAAILHRLRFGGWYLNDVREAIRLGLIGGGMAPDKAMEAVKRHVDESPLESNRLLAYQIVAAVMVGVPDDPVGKEKPVEDLQAGLSSQMGASAGLN